MGIVVGTSHYVGTTAEMTEIVQRREEALGIPFEGPRTPRSMRDTPRESVGTPGVVQKLADETPSKDDCIPVMWQSRESVRAERTEDRARLTDRCAERTESGARDTEGPARLTGDRAKHTDGQARDTANGALGGGPVDREDKADDEPNKGSRRNSSPIDDEGRNKFKWQAGEVEPLQLMDWGKAWDKFKLAQSMESQSTSGLGFYVMSGYKKPGDMLTAARGCRGGWCTRDENGRITSMVFGEHGWDGRTYGEQSKDEIDRAVREIITISEECPVWVVTGLWVDDGRRATDYLRKYMTYFKTWNGVFNICVFFPKWMEYGIDLPGKTRYSKVELRDSSETLMYSLCTGAVLENCPEISNFYDDEDMLNVFSSQHPRAYKRSKGMVGTDLGFVRACLLNKLTIAKDGGLYGKNHMCIEAQLEALGAVYGITPRQTLGFARPNLPGLVFAKVARQFLEDKKRYDDLGFGAAYLSTIAFVYKVKLADLTESLKGKAGTADDIVEALERRHVGKSTSRERTLKEELQALWRGMHVGEGQMPRQFVRALTKHGVSEWLMQKAWKAAFDFQRHTGKLVWLEKYLGGLGFTVEQYCEMLSIDMDKYLRAVQYDVDIEDAKHRLGKCTDTLRDGRTVMQVLRSRGIEPQDYVRYRLGLVGNMTSELRKKCVDAKFEIGGLRLPPKAADKNSPGRPRREGINWPAYYRDKLRDNEDDEDDEVEDDEDESEYGEDGDEDEV